MSNLRAPLLVGLVGVAAVVTLFLLFGTVRKDVVSEGKGYRVYADFEDVAGWPKVQGSPFPGPGGNHGQHRAYNPS